jgi:hypothetical protein
VDDSGSSAQVEGRQLTDGMVCVKKAQKRHQDVEIYTTAGDKKQAMITVAAAMAKEARYQLAE